MTKRKGVYGFVDNDGIHHDTGYSLLGAKQCATRRNFYNVSIRYGYTAIILEEKVNGNWSKIVNED